MCSSDLGREDEGEQGVEFHLPHHLSASKRRLNSLRKMDAADGDGSIVESLDKLAKEAAELADLLRNGQ